MRPLLIALGFLTRLPVPLAGEPQPRDIGRSILFYPLVGLAIGLLLAGLARLLDGAPGDLAAALLLAAWVAITGALHLDGLGDSADGWMGGGGDRERTLAIMKDPRSGTGGVVAVSLLLIVKFAALKALLEGHPATALILAPLLGRACLPLLFLTTPYVRPGGLGSALAGAIPRRPAWLVVLAVTAGVALTWRTTGLWLLAVTLGSFLLLRGAMVARLGGTTGDTAGATVETVEAAVLVTAALL